MYNPIDGSSCARQRWFDSEDFRYYVDRTQWPIRIELGPLVQFVYERQQISKRGRGIERVLIDRIKGASEQLWAVVNPTLDEIMENAEACFRCAGRRTAAEVLATPDTWFGRLSVATDVLGTRESNAEDEERIRTMEDANGGHN